MTRMTSQLVMELLDRVTAPAQRVAESLQRITGAVGDVNARQMGMGQRLDAAISRNNAALSSARMGMVDAAAGAYILHRALGAPVRVAAEFERGMNRVGVLSSATEEQIGLLSQQARELGRTTMFSATQATEGMGFLAQAGFDAEQILGAMPGTLQLAAAGQLELAQAADIATNVLSGYGLAVDQLERVNDVLIGTATTTNTSVQQMAEAMSYAAPVASMMGMEFEEAAAALGLMGNAGIQASRAGTSLQAILNSLVSPSTSAAEQMEELGINVLDAAGNVRPMAEIMEQFESAFGDVVDVVLDAEGALLDTEDAIVALEGAGERGRVILDLFGRRGGPAMAALLSQGSEALREQTEATREFGGTAERVADVEMEGFRGRMQALWSAVEGLQLSLGNALLPALTRLAEVATNALGPITALAEAYPDVTLAVVGGTAAVVAFKVALASLRYVGLLGKGGVLSLLALGFNTVGRAAIGAHAAAKSAIGLQVALAGMSGQPITMLDRVKAGLGGMIIAVPGLGKVGAALRVIAGIGLGKVGAAIGLIAAGGLLIRKYWDRIGSFFSGFADRLRDRFRPELEALAERLEILSPIVDAFASAWRSVADGVSSAWDYLSSLLDREILGDDDRTRIADAGADWADRFIGGIEAAVQLRQRGLIATMGDLGAQMGESLWQGATPYVDMASDWGADIVARVDSALTNAEQILLETGQRWMQSLWDGMVAIWDGLIDWVAEFGASIAESIGTIDLGQIGADIIQSLWDGMVGRFNSFIQWVREIPSRIREAIGNIDLSGAIRLPSLPTWLGGSDAPDPPASQGGAAGAGGTDLPARARGGRVSRGGQYQVGERGWELFSPRRSGYIFPHHEALEMMLSPLGHLPDLMRRDPLAGVMAPINRLHDLIPRDTDSEPGSVRVEILQPDDAPAVPPPGSGPRPQLPPVSITIGSLSIQGSGEPADVSRLVARVRGELEREMREAMRAVYADTGVRTY